MARRKHHIVLIPGLLGFAQLGGFDYFMHVEEALARRFLERGAECDFVLVSSPPTASIVRRTRVLRESIDEACGEDEGPIHLIGHSTGGLDARLLACPTARPEAPAWFDRVQSAVSISTPHYGAPLAQYFTTMAGAQLLNSLSIFTFVTLRFGGPPLTVLSPVIAMLGRAEEALGLDVKVFEKMTELLLSFIGEQGQAEVREWFEGIREDKGAIFQLTPEAMDIFNAAVEDNQAIKYGSVVTRVPTPAPVRVASGIRSPVAALSAAFFSTLYVGASIPSKIYPVPMPGREIREYIEEKIGRDLEDSLNDGFVPTKSMVWGSVLWAGIADHLDTLGHFHGDRDSPHTDWLVSGAGFSESDFDEIMDAIVDFQLGPR
jgi:pimeloyl-ACP methyl ester carboxylesterase